MNLFRRLIIALTLIAALTIAAYLFVWLFAAFLILAPVAYFYFRWRFRKMRQRMKNRSEAIIIDHQQIN